MYEALNKVYDVQQTNWDPHVLVVLWAYRTTCKKLMEKMPLRLEYGVDVRIPIEYNMPCPCIVALVYMLAHGALEEGITPLNEVERLGPEEEI